MGVCAYHHVDAKFFKPVGQFLLVAVGQEPVFVAPVDADDHDVGVVEAGKLYVVSYLLFFYIIYDDAIGGCKTVGSVRIVQERRMYAVYIEYGRYRFVARRDADIRPYMGYA